MVIVSRKYRFSASHRLHVRSLTNERNDELFGKCNNPFGHGHNYEVEVSVEGAIDAKTGLAVNPQTLDALVNEAIVRRYDHRYLNEELPEFFENVPTTENLARQIEQHLLEAWPSSFPADGPRLCGIRIFETANNIFELTR